jgi:DNA-binding MurR/RpiR family transcriptional regulator
MTRSERRIGEHLAQHPLDAAFLAAARLSELVGVSESSVLRFSRVLGYASYPALQQEMQDEVRRRLTRNTPERLQEASARASDEAAQLAAALETDIRNLQVTRQQIDDAEFKAFVDHLASAERVYVIGMRGAAPTAELLGYSLSLLRPGVEMLAHSADRLGDHLADINPRDVLIGFAFSRQSVHTIGAVDLAVAAGTPVLAVTDDPISPIARRAKHALLVAMQSEAFIQSYTAAIAVTHALLAAVGKRLQESAMERLTRIEAVMESSRVFFLEEE